MFVWGEIELTHVYRKKGSDSDDPPKVTTPRK